MGLFLNWVVWIRKWEFLLTLCRLRTWESSLVGRRRSLVHCELWVSPTLAWIFFFFWSRDVCELMVGSVLKDSWWKTLRSRKGSFLDKNATCTGCFILTHCHCQTMCVHVALPKSICFRETFESLYRCCDNFHNHTCGHAVGRLSVFGLLIFYYFTVWCLRYYHCAI